MSNWDVLLSAGSIKFVVQRPIDTSALTGLSATNSARYVSQKPPAHATIAINAPLPLL